MQSSTRLLHTQLYHTEEHHKLQLWTFNTHAYCGRLIFSYINKFSPLTVSFTAYFFSSFRHLSNASGEVIQRLKKRIKPLALESFKRLGYKLWWQLYNSINILKTTELSTENGRVVWSQNHISIKLFLNSYKVQMRPKTTELEEKEPGYPALKLNEYFSDSEKREI